MKKIGLIVAAAAMFDLGTVVVSSQASEAIDYHLKIDMVASGRTVGGPRRLQERQGEQRIPQVQERESRALAPSRFCKIDKVNTPQACMAKGGTVVQHDGQAACKVAFVEIKVTK